MATEPTTAMARRPRGRYPKTQDGAVAKLRKRIPEYLEADEVNTLIRLAPNPKAKLLMLEQWRAGLRVSEALDLSLDTPLSHHQSEDQAKEVAPDLCRHTRNFTPR